MDFHRRACLALGLSVLGVPLLPAHAQTFPDKPIRLVVPAPPGGGLDAVGRQVAEALTQILKQPIVIDNRPGGQMLIGSEIVAKAPADGYTLLLTGFPHVINPYLLKKIPFDSLKDFAPVSRVGSAPFLLVASSLSGVASVADFKAYAAKRPGELSFAVSDPTTRMATEMFFAAAQVKGSPVLVTYKGTGPAMADVAAGHVPFFVVATTATLPFRGTNRVNFVGMASEKKVSLFPEVLTLAEQGVKVSVSMWYGVLAPARTPAAVLDRLDAAIAQALALPDVAAKLRTQGIEPAPMGRADFQVFMQQEFQKVGEWAKTSKVEPE